MKKLMLVSIVLSLFAASASAQCPTRDEVQSLIFAGESPEAISGQFPNCVPTTTTFDGRQQTTPTGSVFWEEIDACGYHPQRRELHCAVEVKQRFGFAGTPLGGPGFNGPGSFEWVQFCVDYNDGAGLVPVNISAVRVHDEPFGVQPSWYYGVSVAADPRLHQTVVNGQTLRARAILSWTLIPTGCNFTPVWGNQADFKIKLDP